MQQSTASKKQSQTRRGPRSEAVVAAVAAARVGAATTGGCARNLVALACVIGRFVQFKSGRVGQAEAFAESPYQETVAVVVGRIATQRAAGAGPVAGLVSRRESTTTHALATSRFVENESPSAAFPEEQNAAAKLQFAPPLFPCHREKSCLACREGNIASVPEGHSCISQFLPDLSRCQ